jgi:hypothetical protein
MPREFAIARQDVLHLNISKTEYVEKKITIRMFAPKKW